MKDFTHIDGKEKTGLDFLADLWSGRVHRTLFAIHTQIGSLESKITALADWTLSLQKENKQMSLNSEKLLAAASVINNEIPLFRTQFESLKAKVAALQEQAAAPHPAVPEDLSQEFQALNESLNNLASLASSETLTPAEPTLPVDPVIDVAVPDVAPATSPLDPEPPGATVSQTPVPAETAPTETAPTEVIPDRPATPPQEEVIPTQSDIPQGQETPTPEIVGGDVVPAPAEVFPADPVTQVPTSETTSIPAETEATHPAEDSGDLS